MAVKIILSNASQVTSREPTLDEDNNVKFSRMFYQHLGSLVKNKTLLDDYNSGKLAPEYVRFLNDMNDLFLKRNYPLLATDIVLEEAVTATDEYLGDLGITQDYHYSKDAVNIPAWIDSYRQSEYRILMDTSDNTYLVDPADGTVLVAYT